MKVMCIRDIPLLGHTKNGLRSTPDEAKICIGEVYTVVNEMMGYEGELMYVLEERKRNYRYKSSRFAPLSDIDEKELIEEHILPNQLNS